MTPEEATETAWRIHGAIGEWTARVDAKASFALTLESAALAGVVALSQTTHVFGHLHGLGDKAILWLGVLLLLMSAAFAILVVVPRLRSVKDLQAESPRNLIYFGHLRHWDPDRLPDALLNQDMLPVLSLQLVKMSDIAWRKHRHVQYSMALAALGGVFVFVAGLLT
ncbi:hypothetical protein ABIA33_004712 [Streptacidiphilus sp. MAP12-16]|uniref:Pycsar system effector family protein n=1 Tax=Streptacidiphilus sp. MAP12-16 TaxID=3156300 RepID=UPI003515BC13